MEHLQWLALANVITGTATYILGLVGFYTWTAGSDLIAQYMLLRNQTVPIPVLLWTTGLLVFAYGKIAQAYQYCVPHITETTRNCTRVVLFAVVLANTTAISGSLNEYLITVEAQKGNCPVDSRPACDNNGALGDYRLQVVVVHALIGCLWLVNGILSTTGSVLLLVRTFYKEQLPQNEENEDHQLGCSYPVRNESTSLHPADDLSIDKEIYVPPLLEGGRKKKGKSVSGKGSSSPRLHQEPLETGGKHT